MKKVIYITFIFLISNQIIAQDKASEKIDTAAIVFKAKLFTISKHSSIPKEKLLTDIDSMQFDRYLVNDFLFIKVTSKRYCYEEGNYVSFIWCDCDYYLAYSMNSDVFYFLGGFARDDIKVFALAYTQSIFKSGLNYKIRDRKLSEFENLIIAGKVKKAKRIFSKCIETWEKI